MTQRPTEMPHPDAVDLDRCDPRAFVEVLVEAQHVAVAAVRQAAGQVAAAARLVADCLASGGRLVYVGAGSSGLQAHADALELPGTFGIARNRIVVLFAGAPDALFGLAGDLEDDGTLGRRDVVAAQVGAGDCVIAVSASGSTPYTLAALQQAVARGAATVAIANNVGSPLLAAAAVPVPLVTGSEMVAGSTRMAAGTAQKIALNILSTLAAFHLGHVVNGEMVNLQADNIKLRHRAVGIVSRLGKVDAALATDCLERAGFSTRHAVLLAAGVPDLATARDRLDAHDMNLRLALRDLHSASIPPKAEIINRREGQ